MLRLLKVSVKSIGIDRDSIAGNIVDLISFFRMDWVSFRLQTTLAQSSEKAALNARHVFHVVAQSL